MMQIILRKADGDQIIRYCDKLTEIKTKKEFERKQIIEELNSIKLEGNYPKIKMYESKEALLDSHLFLINHFIKAMLESCPRENSSEDSCDISCKTYYDYVLSVCKHEKK